KRAFVVERPRCDCAGRRPAAERIPVSRDSDLRQRRDAALRRRPDQNHPPASGAAQKSHATDPPGRRVRRKHLTPPPRPASATHVLTWEGTPQTITAPLPRPSQVTDFWSGEEMGRREGNLAIKDLPPHSARLLICK